MSGKRKLHTASGSSSCMRVMPKCSASSLCSFLNNWLLSPRMLLRRMDALINRNSIVMFSIYLIAIFSHISIVKLHIPSVCQCHALCLTICHFAIKYYVIKISLHFLKVLIQKYILNEGQ